MVLKKRIEREKPNRQQFMNYSTDEGLLLKIVKGISQEDFDGNIKKMAEHFDVDYRKLLNLTRRPDHFNRFDPLPRIVKTTSERKLVRVVESAWEKRTDTFEKWDVFIQNLKKELKSQTVDIADVKTILRNANIRIVNAKNIINEEDEHSYKIRTQHATNLKKKIVECSKSGKDIYFFGEYTFNQRKEEDNSYLSPMGITVYKEKNDSNINHADSVTLLLMVSSSHEVIHYKLYSASAPKTDYNNRVSIFFIEVLKKIPQGKHYLYIDNVECYTHVFDKKNKNPNTDKLIQTFDLIWALPSTPECNLVDFCFNELKQLLKKKLTNRSGSLTAAGWLSDVTDVVFQWKHENDIDTDLFDYIIEYVNKIIKYNGNLQIIALADKGYTSLEDALADVHFD